MKPILRFVSIFFLCFNLSLNAQDIVTEISGVINHFTTVTSINDCTSELGVSSTQGFEPGMSVVLLQTKGARVNTSNNSSFGEFEALHNTGQHETNEVLSITANSISLKYELLNDYDITDGDIQLVTMPSYENVEVSDVLTTTAWDGNTGGVLAFKVSNVLTLNADIDASGAGFRGGAMVSAENNCIGGINNANSFFYETGNWRGANKGEGIADATIGRELGKGAQGNGGGGGNDHNSGGGGGGHVGSGGNGGERDTPFLTTSCKGSHPGVSGYAISDIENRIFFGGGGGAGHTNNQAGSGGGNGGGIIIIQAPTIIANGHRIMANGITPPLVTQQDGAGGGGAGGTVVIEAEEVIGQLFVAVQGGNGGSIDLSSGDECFGSGGGGSGGRYLSNVTTGDVQVSVVGGTPGTSSSSDNGCTNATNGASNGQNGITTSFSGIVQGETLGGAVAIVEQPEDVFFACHDTPAVIDITTQGLNLEYQWQVNQGGGFVDLEDNGIYSGTNTSTLTLSEVTTDMMGFTYILVINSMCSEANDVSNFFTIELINAPVPAFDYTVNDREVTFNNLSQFSDGYQWSFGTSDSTTVENPVYTYEADGQYYVTLTVHNECGSFEISEFISIGTFPTAAFDINTTEGCAPLTVEFTNQSSDNTSGLLWFFEGGTPSTSTAENPVVSFSSGGSYNVMLIAGNETGNDTLEMIDIINIDAGPNTAFFVDANELEVSFNNTTGNGTSYIWDFGDNMGNSTEINPTYTYAEEGEYTATLIATNDCGSNTYELNFTTGSLPNASFTVDNGVGCAPLTVEYVNQSSGTNVGNWIWEFEGGVPTTSTEENPVVEYPSPGVFKTSLNVSNNLGSSTREMEEFITVYDEPEATFTYDIDDGVVSFNSTGNPDNIVDYAWVFGDGTFSNEPNPTHTYINSGVYSVTLHVTNLSCGNTISEIINITLSSVEQVEPLPEIMVYPNPTKGQLIVRIADEPLHEVQLALYHVNGQQLAIQSTNISQALRLDLGDLAQGVYFLKIVADEWQTVRKVTLSR